MYLNNLINTYVCLGVEKKRERGRNIKSTTCKKTTFFYLTLLKHLSFLHVLKSCLQSVINCY